MSLIRNKNKIKLAINNSLKANGDNTYKVIEQLAKLGLFKTSKKRGPRKAKATAEAQTDAEAGGYAETEEEKKAEETPGDRATRQLSNTMGLLLSNIQPRGDGGFNNQRLEDVKRQGEQSMAVIRDQFDKYRERLMNQEGLTREIGRRAFQPQERIFPNQDLKIEEVDEETMTPEINEYDFENQGTQNAPENVLKVDVSPPPSEFIEDEERAGFYPAPEEPQAEAQAEAEPEPKKVVKIKVTKPLKKSAETETQTEPVAIVEKAQKGTSGIVQVKNVTKYNRPLIYKGLGQLAPNPSKEQAQSFLRLLNISFEGSEEVAIPNNKADTLNAIRDKIAREDEYLQRNDEKYNKYFKPKK